MPKASSLVKLYDRYTHNCPDCGRLIRWALTYCALCSWRGKPRPNRAWDESDECQN